MAQSAPLHSSLTTRLDDHGPYGPVVNGTQIVFYEYRPNQVAAITFVALFAITTLWHIGRLFLLRSWFLVPLVLGGICEVFGYYGRAWSHKDPAISGPFILQNVLLLAGPPFLAASIYMSLGRITTALNAQHLSFISPRWMTKIYVLIDIGCIISQFMGALMPVSGDPDSIRKGQMILIGGLVTQLVALSFFILTAWHISHRMAAEMRNHPMGDAIADPKRHFRTLELVTALMIVRSIVRSVEFFQGQGGYVISHEIFIYLFDAALIFLIMLALLIVHPGYLIRAASEGKEHNRGHVRLQSLER